MTSIAQSIRQTFSRTLLAGVLATMGLLGAVPGAAFAESNEAAEARAENAGIFTAQLPVAGSNIASGKAVIVVDKPIEEVLPIVLDYGNYVQFMPNFTRSKVLAQRGTKATVYMEVSVAKGMYTLYGQLKLAEQPQNDGVRVVKGRLIDGNIDAFDASFTLKPVEGGTEIVFDIYVDPDLPLPSAVFSRENERAAGRAVRALRDRIARGAGPTA